VAFETKTAEMRNARALPVIPHFSTLPMIYLQVEFDDSDLLSRQIENPSAQK